MEHALTRSVGGSGSFAAAHSRTNSNVSERVQSTIDKLQSHMGAQRISPHAMQAMPHSPSTQSTCMAAPIFC